MSTLLGPDGRPISSKDLTREVAVPTTIGVRNVWADTMSGELTPDRVSIILKNAAQGENREFLGLAEEMEEREGHYGSVLGQRKRAVSGIDPIVKAASDDKHDKKIADAVSEMVNDSNLALAVDDFLDGLGKGYSSVEMRWDYGRVWKPIEYISRDPRFYQFDRLDGRTIKLRVDGDRDGRPLTAAERFAHVFHVPRLKSGLPVRNGLARLAIWSFVLKSYTMQDWMRFLEVYGMPLRLGKFDSNASNEEKRILLRAVRDLGTDAAAIIPRGMEIDLVESKGGSGNAVYGAMADYIDKQLSKIVLGQTMTTDAGSSLSQAEVHQDVKLDIRKADARQLAATLTRDTVIPFVCFNFGPQERYPQLDFPVAEPEDLKQHAEILSKLVPVGLEVQMSDVRDRFGWRTPDAGAKLLTQPAAEQPAPADPALASSLPLCAHCGTRHLAAAKDHSLGADDELIAEAMSHHERDLAPIVDKIIATAEASDDFDDFLARLQTVTLDTSGLAARLAALQMKARGRGELDA